jgi:peptide/nickel transport system ATP-binding protein
MYRGQQLEFGDTRELFLNPEHPYTKGLIACKPNLETEKKKLLTVSDYMKEDGMGVFTELVPSNPGSLAQVSKSANAILSIQDLVTRYSLRKSIFGKTTEYLHAVDQVTLEVFEGETLGLVGESGCGKSTLGRSIMGLSDDCLGSIIYDGNDILKMSPKEINLLRTDIQYIFQDPYASLNPRMLIKDILIEPMMINNVLSDAEERLDKAVELLETVGLGEEALMKYPHEFSGGQRQRICVARTLALQPKIVICDESVSALDVSVQAQVLNLLNDLKEKFKFTYIFISHDLSVVKYMADRLVVMKEGKIVESGNPEEIYQNPKEDYTKKLIASIPKGISA